jgi:hypothetical protein
MDKLTEIGKKLPNDQDLGKYVRSLVRELKSNEIEDIVKEYPNDFDLGKQLRKKINQK